MRNPFWTPFAAVFTNEVLLNVKRVAPYALMLLFSANAILWWGWGPAVANGWATNSDFYIRRNFGGFAFILGLPLFTAVIMGDPVVRDFRLGVHPLIFSKPIDRGAYLLGKFFGNFFVLVCCQSVFAITLFVLQWVPFSGMVTLPVQVVPYFKHFFIVVVISHLVLAAFYFAAGTLTRNAKIVYGLAACFYPAYIGYLFLLRELPIGVRVVADPFGSNLQLQLNEWSQTAEFLNQYVVRYSTAAYANRASMIVISALLLLIVYFRFALAAGGTKADEMTVLKLSSAAERIAIDPPIEATVIQERVPLPRVRATQGPATTLAKILAGLGVEFRLLRAERSLIVLVPLATFLSLLELITYRVVPVVSYSVTYASGTTTALLLFLVGMIVFYTGEAMHRDREFKIEPVLWATPVSNSVLLLSKFLATVVLALSLIAMVGLTAIVVQVLRGDMPLDVSAYLKVYGVVLVPGIIFMTALVVLLNVLLRTRYLAYIVSVGIGAALVYLYGLGYNHWTYNPLLIQLWKYSDLTSRPILAHRLYCLALGAAFLVLAHLLFKRRRNSATISW